MHTEFRDPVLPDLMTGDVYAMDNVTSTGELTVFDVLPLADYPLAIAEKDLIALKS